MTAVRRAARAALPSLLLIAGLAWATTSCGEKAASGTAGTESAPAPSGTAWKEPSSYTYTLTSSEGERALIGTFHVTVRDHKVVKAAGLDDSSRRVVKQSPAAVPTIAVLLDELAQARRENADTAEAEYAADGHPARITLDWEKNAVDDEALYVISAYEPAHR
ncbi:DUF6174 domain-containing protein [Streptomyces tibetensis]|uniref:DUF6174 domain-containing protein n=1 Tax=Streptomyces tibetensis TaxID=2382123 RepID=UPI0033D7F2C5